jgi:hypothetical protein
MLTAGYAAAACPVYLGLDAGQGFYMIEGFLVFPAQFKKIIA